ncbi:alanine aminotransferase 2 isoform X2 [Rhipicephalus sanguineus]|uniref:alanine aminotransferase 2 isoform X2 n=1 Tax=Rhipicephalus sanguineus TaxID=34632 RepID=UPI001893023B|nr:alanine aminotransferase 2 isoform X2 [Rhipicephalus sanguineus]
MNDKAVSMRGNDVPVTRLGFAPYRVMLSMIREIEDKLKEVVGLCALPEIASHVPSDVVQRARDIIKHCPGGAIGAIQNQDHPLIQRHIAEHISQRDSVEARPEDIWATDGVTHGVTTILEVLKRRHNGTTPGFLTCVPTYMGYFTLLRQYGYHEVCYYLDEDHGWAHNTDEMQKALDASKSVCVPRCLLLVNPANPPSTVLSMKQLQDIIMFAHKNHLIILADEVFEYNIYDINHPFHSVRKVMNTMSAPYSRTALISFNSLAKGFTVEAGLRSGYFEAINLDSVDQAYLEEAMEADRPSMLSQAALDCIVRPPGLGDPSYELYTKEKTSTLDSLARRAKMAEKRLNAIPGFHCGPVQGSMAAYARITIPAKAIEEAKRRNKQADVFYAEELLKAKGISVTPSSAFGRLPGRYHIRITILAPDDRLMELFDRLEAFHKDFMVKYA